MDKIKIRFISNDISFNYGGEKVTIQLTQDFKNMGIDSGIISYYHKHPVHNSNVVYLFETPINLKFNMFFIIKRLRKYVLQNKIDCLIDTKFALSLCSILATFGTNCQVVFQAHSNYYEAKSWASKLSLFLLKLCKCKIILLTNRDKETYIKNGFLEQNISIIPNYIERSSNYNYNKTSKKFLSVGALEDRKRFDVLIKVFYDFSLIFDDWTLDIYGDGPEYDKLEKLILSLKLENKVFLKGFSSQIIDVVSSGYAGFVFASRAEAFPLVLLEALANGLPVISTNCYTGPAEILNSDCGFLVENENEFFMQMIKLAEDENLRVKMSYAAYQRAKDFNKEVILKKWSENLYIINSRKIYE